jgi:hypothetical protein
VLARPRSLAPVGADTRIVFSRSHSSSDWGYQLTPNIAACSAVLCGLQAERLVRQTCPNQTDVLDYERDAPVGAWLSLVERLVRDQEVEGSNPSAPTKYLFRINKINVLRSANRRFFQFASRVFQFGSPGLTPEGRKGQG